MTDAATPVKPLDPALIAKIAAFQRALLLWKIRTYKPYPWQKEFHAAGAHNPERMLMAANRVGKTQCAAAEVAFHLTGDYPSWWEGKRFLKPTLIWTGSPTNETSRDIVQTELLGGLGEKLGTGWVPRAKIVGQPQTRQAGVKNVIDTFQVRHVSGGLSTCNLKCHPAGERALMADGRWKDVKNVVVGDWVRCADGVNRMVDQTHSYFGAPIWEVVTRCGSIKATPNHPMFTQRGKLRVDELVVGDVLEIADCDAGADRMDDWRVIWTALMIGDGCTRSRRSPIITCAEPPLLAEAASHLPPTLHVRKLGNSRPYDYKVVGHTNAKGNPLKVMLERDGLWHKKSAQKFVPEWVFALCREQRILFLHWLWSTDGTVGPHHSRYDTTSLRLARDVRLLLFSVGIHGRVKSRGPGKPGYNDRHYVELSGHERIKFDEIGKFGRCMSNFKRGRPQPKGPRGEIIEIRQIGTGIVYGCGIPEVHELIVEGFRTGNTYEQGWHKWQGTAPHVVWDDEEPDDYMIYSESQTRILTSGGILLVTFTPLRGVTDLVEHFQTLHGSNGVWLRGASWDDAPHLSAEDKARLSATYRSHEVKARTQGIPMMGEGAVFPIDDDEIKVDPFKIPDYFARIKGCDFGIDHPAAGVELAFDRDKDIVYVIDCYRKANEKAPYHAAWFNKVNPQIPVAWPHDGMNREKNGGETIANGYRQYGVNMLAKSARYPKVPGQDEKGGGQPVEPIVDQVYERMLTGRFKVFSHLNEWFEEKRGYHRKDNIIVAKRDDILKATFYGLMMIRYAMPLSILNRQPQSMAPMMPIASTRL